MAVLPNRKNSFRFRPNPPTAAIMMAFYVPIVTLPSAPIAIALIVIPLP